MKFKALILAFMLGTSVICAAADQAAAPAKVTVSTAPAQSDAAAVETAAAENPENAGFDWARMVPMILIFVVMIFIFSRSNKKQQQKRQEMLDRIVKGTRVMLNSGVYGKVSEVREKEFLVEIAENVKVLVVKNGIASVEDEENKNGNAK
ncbi:MAG: preprotein translocase subunit YajC [Lentisphaeria bacterium]|nr:preprotein translocase subunit YajC [Lentisphaeria bacterium]